MSRNLRKYIAILLLGIFLFPLTYQSWHIVQHHLEIESCKHHEHHLEKQNSIDYLESFASDNDSCPICDFKINTTSTSESSNLALRVLCLSSDLIHKYYEDEFSSSLESISSRAPPFTNSIC